MFPSRIAVITKKEFLNLRYLAFGGTDEYVVNTTSNYRSSDDLGSISVWIKTSDTSSYQAIFGSCDEAGTSNNFALFKEQTTGKLYINQQNGSGDDAYSVTGSTNIADGAWHHIVVTSTGSTYAIYVDKVAESLTGTNNGDWLGDTDDRDNFTIGALKRDSVQYFWIGGLDELAIYSKVLSTAEIAALYGSGTPQTTIDANNISNLVGYWRMEEGSGTSVVDSSTSSNVGTLTNMEDADWTAH